MLLIFVACIIWPVLNYFGVDQQIIFTIFCIIYILFELEKSIYRTQNQLLYIIRQEIKETKEEINDLIKQEISDLLCQIENKLDRDKINKEIDDFRYYSKYEDDED
jgi:hypothetical protein